MAAFTVAKAPVVAKLSVTKRASASAAARPALRSSNFSGKSLVARFSARSNARQNSLVVRASELQDSLAETIKAATECVTDCAAIWDEVEELSAASADAAPAPQVKEASLSEEAKAAIAAAQEALKEAEVKASATGAVMDDLLVAQANVAKVTKEAKKDNPRIAELEGMIEEAIKAATACTDDCAADWDTVEELSAAKSHLEK